MPIRRHCFASWTVGMLWSVIVASPLVGQTPVTKLPAPVPTEIPTSPLGLLDQSLIPDPQGVVVLLDGRSFSGTVREVPGGYRVQTGATFNILPFDQVLVTGETLSQAYAALRDSVPIHTVESHLKLAGWCRDQGLLPEAKLEVAATQAATQLADSQKANTELSTLLKETQAAMTSAKKTADELQAAMAKLDAEKKQAEAELAAAKQAAMKDEKQPSIEPEGDAPADPAAPAAAEAPAEAPAAEQTAEAPAAQE